ncbi:hypothetical protein [Clostridium sp. M14]|uniref:hypothetical protein n=1 Tax=Clostridium sp. M14 TaxID=2716311 RepID=UPI0013EE4DAC|nr:hypothetical protein [Clostridium sp. M14]MBZ9693356.1 hypothetical protein [Clostridium sp. M14]
MLKGTSIFDNNNILSTISKDIQPIVVFIQQKGEVNTKQDIEKLKLMCNESDLNGEKLLMEFYSDLVEAVSRVMQFNEYNNHYYVSAWDNGEFLGSNVEEENIEALNRIRNK